MKLLNFTLTNKWTKFDQYKLQVAKENVTHKMFLLKIRFF